jgi:hypothetical protein
MSLQYRCTKSHVSLFFVHWLKYEECHTSAKTLGRRVFRSHFSIDWLKKYEESCVLAKCGIRKVFWFYSSVGIQQTRCEHASLAVEEINVLSFSTLLSPTCTTSVSSCPVLFEIQNLAGKLLLLLLPSPACQRGSCQSGVEIGASWMILSIYALVCSRIKFDFDFEGSFSWKYENNFKNLFSFKKINNHFFHVYTGVRF